MQLIANGWASGNIYSFKIIERKKTEIRKTSSYSHAYLISMQNSFKENSFTSLNLGNF